jgi:hypothetical protein
VAGATVAVLALVVIEKRSHALSVIIATLNEAQAIGRVLADLSCNLATEVIVYTYISVQLEAMRQ